MKIKTRNLILFLLLLLPWIVSLISLKYLPSQIPAHYNFQGEVDRWGSKYEVMIMPILILILCGAMGILIKRLSNNSKYKPNIKVLEITNICMALTFNITCYSMVFSSFKKVTNLNESFLLKLIYTTLCISIILLGNYLPKCKRNSIIGIRTKWTLESDEVWYKTHRYIGKITVVAGILSTILSLVINANLSLILLLITLLGITVISLFYSYKISKNN